MTLEEYNRLPNHFHGLILYESNSYRSSIEGEWIKAERNNAKLLIRLTRWAGYTIDNEYHHYENATVLGISEVLK